MPSHPEIRAKWLSVVLSTEPADRARAEAAVKALYTAGGFTPPQFIVWFDGPIAASWAVALLLAPHNPLWREIVESASRSDSGREAVERARSALGDAVGPDPDRFAAAAGMPLGVLLQYPPVSPRLLQTEIVNARLSLHQDVSALFVAPSDEDALWRAEDRFWGTNHGVLISPLHGAAAGVVGQSALSEYTLTNMADDEARIAGGDPPPVLRAAWRVAQSSGPWWPFANAVVLSDRPVELHTNDRGLLHRGDGPAAVYRDGTCVYAWNGMALPEDWVRHPERIPPRELKHFDAGFRSFVAARAGPVPRPAKRKTSAILQSELPDGFSARIDRLRAHAGGQLPHFDRYQAGRLREVWTELLALGTEVRRDPYAADALAVAYETMRRVELNVRTVRDRLAALGYDFVMEGGWLRRDRRIRPHAPPTARVHRALLRFERRAGPLPLSLRAFYEVVGGVNFIGRHPGLAPPDGRVAPDPLLVYAFAEELVERDEGEDESAAIVIAPDDLHKVNTSGGAPYEMGIPDPRADGELLNERHGVLFVDYLRLAFQYGGFPGYEGTGEEPAEIATLREGLVDF